MAAKELGFDVEARARLKVGVDKLARAVKREIAGLKPIGEPRARRGRECRHARVSSCQCRRRLKRPKKLSNPRHAPPVIDRDQRAAGASPSATSPDGRRRRAQAPARLNEALRRLPAMPRIVTTSLISALPPEVGFRRDIGSKRRSGKRRSCRPLR